jgi:hypothetical protein
MAEVEAERHKTRKGTAGQMFILGKREGALVSGMI